MSIFRPTGFDRAAYAFAQKSLIPDQNPRTYLHRGSVRTGALWPTGPEPVEEFLNKHARDRQHRFLPDELIDDDFIYEDPLYLTCQLRERIRLLVHS